MSAELRVGDLVWQQMYFPTDPKHDSKIEERIAHGHKYMDRRLMRLAGIFENYEGVQGYDGPPLTRWWLVDPKRPNDTSKMSWVESDWCLVEPALEMDHQLGLF